MADSFKKLAQAQVAVTSTTRYTAPGGGKGVIVKSIRVVNLDASSRWVKLWHDGTADANVILPQITIPAGGILEWEGTICMEPSDTLSDIGEVASQLTITIYGDELS